MLRGHRSKLRLRRWPRSKPRNEDLGRRRLVAEGAMGSDAIIMPAPALDDDLSLSERVENFTVEQLVSQARIEALVQAELGSLLSGSA